MLRARGTRLRVTWAVVSGLAVLLLLPLASAEIGVSGQVDAPLISSTGLDLTAGGDQLVAAGVEAPLLPTAELTLPVVGEVKSQPSKPHQAPAPGPAPAATPPDLPHATRLAAGQAADAAAIGALVAAPALPWETFWAVVSQWMAQAREAARPAVRPVGRALKALPFLAPLFTRIGGERLLDNPVRARVHEAIAQDPGLSVQDVRERAGVAWGTTVHHLARLERHGLVVSVRHGNHRRYFPANTASSRHRRELSVLSHPTAHRIAAQVAEFPGTDQKGICQVLDLQNPAASKHLSRFERLGLVHGEIVGRSKLYHPTELLHAALGTLSTMGATATADAPPAKHLPLVPPLGAPAARTQELAIAT